LPALFRIAQNIVGGGDFLEAFRGGRIIGIDVGVVGFRKFAKCAADFILGGAAQISQRTKLADAGRRILRHVADDPFTTQDFNLFQAQIQGLGPVAEEWIASYRMVPEGRGFAGVTNALRGTIGLPSASVIAGR